MALQIFDGHNDTLGKFFLEGYREESFFGEGSSLSAHITFEKAQRGGFAGGMFAVFPPHPAFVAEGRMVRGKSDSIPRDIYREEVSNTHAVSISEKALTCLDRLQALSSGTFQKVTSVLEIEECFTKGVLAAVLHFEGAEAIKEDLGNLQSYYERGLRSLGLVWSRPNCFAEGVDFDFPGSPETGAGLSPAGQELVEACNRLGIVVDLSHLNARGFRDVAKISSAPLVASHSCAHSLCPSPRNLLDTQLDIIAESGGVVGINFSVSFLRHDGQRDETTPLEILVNHFRYIADRVGVEHVAFGSDFDGAMVPASLGDASGLGRLVEALRQAGFSEEELLLLGHQNWLRVLRETWKSL